MTGISVIIPTWNRAATLETAILSALDQTFPVAEVLVCDDGSTDESREVVASINHSRVRWLPGLHSGVPACPRNRGIHASRGDWLAFLDSDDQWRPEKLEKQMAFASNTGIDAICANAKRVCGREKNGKNYFAGEAQKNYSFFEIIKENPIICSSVLIKKEILTKCGGFPEDGALCAIEDYALWLRTSTLTDFAFVPEPLVIYRDDSESSVRAYGTTVWEQKIHVLQSFITWASNADFIANKKSYMALARNSLWKAKIQEAKIRIKNSFRKLKGKVNP